MINCYHNDQHPYIATASRADLTDDTTIRDENRYPIVHAVLRRGEVHDTISDKVWHLVYVELEIIRKEGDTDQLVYDIRSELIQFVHSEWKNNFFFYLDNEFYKLGDFRDTLLNKFALLPMSVTLLPSIP